MDDVYKIVVKKDASELKQLEKDLDLQRKKELEAVKTKNKKILEEEKRKTKQLEQQYKVEFKAYNKEKERIAREQTKRETEERRKLARQQTQRDRQGYGYAPESLGDLKRQQTIIKRQLISGLSLKGEKLVSPEIEKLKQELTGLNPTIKSATRELNMMGVKGKRSIHQILETAENVTVTLAGLGYVASRMFDQAKDVIMTAADVETLGVVVHRLGENAGYTRGEIDKHVESIRKMGITSKSAMQVVAKMIQSEIKLKHGVHLADVARNSAVIGLTNTSDAYERIIHALTTLNPMGLKQLGLVMDMNDVYKRHAETLDTTSNELTTAEKRTAMLNEVFRLGEKNVGTYEEAMETVGKKTRSFERYTEEAKVQLGEQFLPIVNKGTDAITSLTKTFTDSEAPMQVFIGSLVLIGGNLANIVPLVTLLSGGKGFKGLGNTMKSAFTGVSGKIMGTVGALAALVIATKLAVDYINSINKEIKQTPEEQKQSIVYGSDKFGQTGIAPSFYDKTKTGKTFYSEKELEDSKKVYDVTKQIIKKKKTGSDEILKKLEDVGKQQGSNSGQLKEDTKEELNLLTLNLEKQEKIVEKIEANRENIGAIKDLQEELNELIGEEDRLRTGVNHKLLEQRQFEIDIGQSIFELNKKMEESTAFSLGLQNLTIDVQRLPEWIEPLPPMLQAVDSSIIALGNSFQGLFSSMIQGGDDALEALKDTMKGIVNAFITSVQAMIFAAKGAAAAKGITTFGLSLITDLPALAGAWIALEVAKGIISGLHEGTENFGGGLAIVGDDSQGRLTPYSELVQLPKGSRVYPQEDLMQLISGAGQGTSQVVNNYINAEIDGIRFFDKYGQEFEQFEIKQRMN